MACIRYVDGSDHKGHCLAIYSILVLRSSIHLGALTSSLRTFPIMRQL